MAIKKPSKTDKKHSYDQKLCQLLDEYSRVLVAAVDNVGSTQLAEIRRGIRGDSVMLMGKNTLIRRCITAHALRTGNENIKAIIPLLQGNVGLIFTKGDLKEVREEVAKYKVGAPARVGLVAPIDVVVPPGNTGLDPSQTSFFQVLNIPTKINKGSVEIVAHVDLIKKGDKVGSSEAALLAKLGIRPFSYGLVITNVYDDGSVFSPEVLDLSEEDLMEKFACGLSMVASLSLAVSYPTLAAAPHMFLNGYKNVLAVAVETDYSFPHADQIKEYLLKYRDWTSLPSDLLDCVFARMGGTSKIRRGPKNVCLAWRNAALWYLYGEFFNTPNPTVDTVVREFRRNYTLKCYYDLFSDSDDSLMGSDRYFCILRKELKKFAATVLSSAKLSKNDKKHAFDQKLCQLLNEYSRVLVLSVDNVGSTKLAEIRWGIRLKSVMLMGKNTLIRRCISAHANRTGNEKIKAMTPLINGNVGLIFTKGDLKEVREEVAKYKVVITNVYDDGLVFSPEALDHTEEDLMEKFACGISMVASLSLAVSYPTLAAAPIMFLNGYKDVLAVAVETDYSFPHADQIKEYLLKYRDWASLPSDLLESIFARMGSTFDIMRGPKNVCLAWRNAALWHVFREFFNIPNPTVDAVVEEFRNSHRQTLHSEAGSSDYEYNDMFSEYHDDPEEGKHWYFSMYIKDLKKFAAAVLSGAEVAPRRRTESE